MKNFFLRFRSAIRLCAAILLIASFGYGQNAASDANDSATAKTDAPPQTASVSDAKNELSVMGGFAPESLNFGTSRNSNFGFAAVRYSRRIAASDNVALKYQVDFVPLALINYNDEAVVQTTPTFVVARNRRTVYGAGLNPVGLQLNFRRQAKVQPFVGLNLGLIYFAKSIPDDRSAFFPERRGARLNFASSAGGGVEFAGENDNAYSVGFKFQHISNASRGNINPGFNQTLFYFGYTFKKW